MSSFDKSSTLVKHQLPEFIRSEHPVFVEFLQKYYEYLEQPGNAVYELKRFQDSYNIDTARGELLTYFKSMILPSFPEKTELSTERIIKASRDFYAKKGTPDSFKFLFNVLYGLDVEVFFPKLQILRASDGKWMQPQAFRLSLSPTYLDSVVLLYDGTLRTSIATSKYKKITVGDIIEINGASEGAVLDSYYGPGPTNFYDKQI